jgi:hypothetical protein
MGQERHKHTGDDVNAVFLYAVHDALNVVS